MLIKHLNKKTQIATLHVREYNSLCDSISLWEYCSFIPSSWCFICLSNATELCKWHHSVKLTEVICMRCCSLYDIMNFIPHVTFSANDKSKNECEMIFNWRARTHIKPLSTSSRDPQLDPRQQSKPDDNTHNSPLRTCFANLTEDPSGGPLILSKEPHV